MLDTTSLPLSKKLAPILSGEIDYFFAWEYQDESVDGCIYEIIGADDATNGGTPAYTACELMKVLPAFVIKSDESFAFEMDLREVRYRNRMISGCFNTLMRYKSDATPAEALGQMVVWLHEEGLLNE